MNMLKNVMNTPRTKAFFDLPTDRSVIGTWGVYDADGVNLMDFDVFIRMTVKEESRVAHNPVEKGGFASYNKVAGPAQICVTLGRTGSASIRSAILERLAELVANTEFISVVTPVRSFAGMTLEGFDYSHVAQNGIDRLVVSLRLREVRQIAAEYGQSLSRRQVRNPADASTENHGKQQSVKFLG